MVLQKIRGFSPSFQKWPRLLIVSGQIAIFSGKSRLVKYYSFWPNLYIYIYIYTYIHIALLTFSHVFRFVLLVADFSFPDQQFLSPVHTRDTRASNGRLSRSMAQAT